jgi:hypothetical protein
MIDRWADLMSRGARKYTARNWEKAATVEEFARFLESAQRHMEQWIKCLTTGQEDGEDHAAAVLFNIQGAEFVLWRLTELQGLTLKDIVHAMSGLDDGSN